jgi:phage/plasmid-like protein (TIGR03299 family)
MAHELTEREDGQVEFFSAVTRGWHQLGQLTERQLTAEEAIKESLLDWTVEQTPVYHKTADGTDLQIPDQFLVRRTDNNHPLSIMSAAYTPIQNLEAFTFFDEIIGAGKACWDTAGSLQGGRKVFMQAELEGNLFLNNNPEDTIKKKILFFTSHDGSKALTGMITPIRVVCQNTLNAALRNHSNCFKIYHRKNYSEKKVEAAKVLGFADAYFDDLQHVMDTLASKTVTSSYVDGFVGALIPAELDPQTGYVHTRTSNRRNEIQVLFQSGMGNNGKTRWDLWNAVTEYVDHHQGGRLTGARKNRSDVDDSLLKAEARFERSILGAGATLKQKAIDLLMAN